MEAYKAVNKLRSKGIKQFNFNVPIHKEVQDMKDYLLYHSHMVIFYFIFLLFLFVFNQLIVLLLIY